MQVKRCHFSKYGTPYETISLEELINDNSGDILARAEESGSESCYVEVARWSHERRRWERYCFEKTMDVGLFDDNGDELDWSDKVKAQHIAGLVNKGNEAAKFIPTLPDWEG